MPAVDWASLPVLLAAGFGAVLLGGIVKGTLGVGLPLVVVPLMSLVIPAPRAMGLVVVPVLLSNFWQARDGGRVGYALRRFGPLIAVQLVVTVTVVAWASTLSLKSINVALGLVLGLAVAAMVLHPRGDISPRQERWAGPLVGVVGGITGGLSSLQGPVIITYLMALNLKREEFIGSISIIYLFSAAPMYLAMVWWGRFGLIEIAWSAVALVPTWIGMKIGTSIRHRLSEALFRRVLFSFLVLLAVMLLFK